VKNGGNDPQAVGLPASRSRNSSASTNCSNFSGRRFASFCEAFSVSGIAPRQRADGFRKSATTMLVIPR
jgi:hypothetical protein